MTINQTQVITAAITMLQNKLYKNTVAIVAIRIFVASGRFNDNTRDTPRGVRVNATSALLALSASNSCSRRHGRLLLCASSIGFSAS